MAKRKFEDEDDFDRGFDEEAILDIMYPDRHEDDWNDDDDGPAALWDD
ncbi:MAG: hypothetical protein J1D77_08410 [Muribaculaceae bacterium]|nr:hypothetical protein [Muribaculaceae bacterium]